MTDEEFSIALREFYLSLLERQVEYPDDLPTLTEAQLWELYCE